MDISTIKWPIALVCTCAVAFIPTSVLPYVPFEKRGVQTFLIALTVGMLLADVFLLMLPHLLHLHHESHEDHEPEPEPAKKENKLMNFFKKKAQNADDSSVFERAEGGHDDAEDPYLAVLLLGFVAFFLLERFFQSLSPATAAPTSAADAAAAERAPAKAQALLGVKQAKPAAGVEKEEAAAAAALLPLKEPVHEGSKGHPEAAAAGGGHHGEAGHHGGEHHALTEGARLALGMDLVHNLSDGLRLGVAFLASLPGGLALSFIYVCHEAAHELGDTATLVQAGQSAHHAIHFQHKTAAALFLGCSIGMMGERFIRASDYLMAAAAGAYLYIACVKMLPNLLATKCNEFKTALIEGAAILLGFFVMREIVVLETDGLRPLMGFANYLIDSSAFQSILSNSTGIVTMTA